RWRERIGPYDEKDLIRLSIIRRIPNIDRYHYSIQISANPDRAEMESGRIVGFTARSLVTEATSDRNLDTFVALYRQFWHYYLIPAICNDVTNEPRFLNMLPVLKRALNGYEAADVTNQHIELMAAKQAQER